MAKNVTYISHKTKKSRVSPVVFDSPHSGTDLPADFKYDCDEALLKEFADLHMHILLRDLPGQGIPVLESKISRAYVDLNRESDEIDPVHIKGPWTKPYRLTTYAQSGHGLFAKRTGRPQGLTVIFNKASRPTQADIERRIEQVYEPYYNELFKLLNRARDENGIAVHVNMHSYNRNKNREFADFVLGDLYGKTCSPEIREFVADFFQKRGYSTAFNTPFKGAALINNTGKPKAGYHSLQIEIARDLYFAEGTTALCPEKEKSLRTLLAELGRELEEKAYDMAARAGVSPASKTSLKL